MLKYKNLNNFYEGTDITEMTPLTSSYLNSIINQIEANFNDLDSRLDAIEEVIINKTIDVNIANIKIGNISQLNTNNAQINNCNISKLESSSGNIENLIVDTVKINNSQIENSNILNLNSKTFVSNNAKIDNLQLQYLKISDNYVFSSESIDFYNNSGINFITSSGNGISFSQKTSNSEANIKINENEFDITFNSQNVNNSFNISSNVPLKISAEKINLNGDIIPNKNSLGNEENPFDKIYSKQIYGSYFSYNADIAEIYEADDDYEEGTILEFGKETEATIAKGIKPVLGVVSKKYAYLLNNNTNYKHKVPVALKGRVYCKLSKKGKRGDYIIVDEYNPGYGYPTKRKPKIECIVGILLDPENNIIKV